MGIMEVWNFYQTRLHRFSAAFIYGGQYHNWKDNWNQTPVYILNGICSLFYADEVMLVATSVERWKRRSRCWRSLWRNLGCSPTLAKVDQWYFKEPELKMLTNLVELMVHELMYLEIFVNDNAVCFKIHKKEKIKQARKMANMTYSVMHKSCN